MCQTLRAVARAASIAHAAETYPDLRSPPMRTRRTTKGTAAANAENAMECSGSNGWFQTIGGGWAPEGITWRCRANRGSVLRALTKAQEHCWTELSMNCQISDSGMKMGLSRMSILSNCVGSS